MTEEEIKQATCQVVGKDEVGTGWLISANLVLTAYHCVEAAVTAGEPVVVRFGTGTAAIEHTTAAGPYDEDLDVCLLQLAAPLQFEPIPISAKGLRPGEKWNAFGYPVAKMQLGHVVRGEIQQVLAERVHRMDLDLSVEPGTHLSDYKGLSGSALIVGSACKGLLRLNIDSALGAVSFEKLKAFLETNALLPREPSSSNAAQDFGTRPEFDELFESSIEKKRNGYLLLDGSHGVGKSTYCAMFRPESQALENLGVYHFTDRARGLTPAQQVQPEVFFDWASSLLSTRATGRPARLMDLTYSQLIEQTGEVFKSLAARSKKAGKTGVLFIDGINEAATVGDDALRRFVGLLPQSVPEGLVIVVTGVGLDSLAASLAPVLQGAERLTLPTLERDIQYGVCTGFLNDDKVTMQIVAALCDRAMGHPLYLRYLADLVNSGASEVDIAELPVFSGAIEDYYETIWSKLALDNDVVNLLGIIARLRWGILVANLTCMLSPAELAVLPSTLLRVRHLLASPENTAIYHPSFSQFVVHKTTLISEWAHTRLFGFCASSQSGDYGVLNKVYHALRGGAQQQLQAIANCQQAWVDNSVLRGTEPDVLLSDIDETLSAATRVGTALDIIRLLLLSQRLTFRYDVLFVQSAEHVAVALVALGKAESALRHVVRNGRLVVSADEAFSVAHALTQRGSTGLTLDVLELVQREINVVFDKMRSGDGLSTREFFTAVNLRMHAFSLARAAGEDPPFTRFLRAIVEGFLRGPNSQFSPEEGAEILRGLSGEMAGAQLCLKAEYRPFSELKLPMDVDLSHQLLIFLQTLAHAQMYSELYGVALNRDMVTLLLEDIARVIDAPLEQDDRRFIFTDALIEAGATPSLVAKYSAGVDLGDGTLPFYEKNRADPAESGFDSAMLHLRASAFLADGYTKPLVRTPTADAWEQDLQALARAVAWCDGKGRRSFAANDQPALDAVWSFVADDLLPSLAFTLESRIHWDSSYFVPETVVPRLYEQLAKLLLECFAAKATVLLDALERGFDIQLGLYNEGFRQALQQVLRLFIERMSGGPGAGKVFTLVMRWRDYVAANVENRFELIPELLQIVPLLARLQADEEALRTYRMVLSFSMGPSWYKEDQLSMMTSTLEALPAASPVPGTSLAQIAALLERATGEMTFQRYIRADKGNYIEELCRRSLFSDAVRYFQHQSCGTLDELFTQAISGNLDRVSTLVGMRFPGAALEEQAALLAMLRNVGGQASWQLRWALLEVYHHGDERHLADWGRQYADIISGLADRPNELALASARVRSIVASLNDERAWLLLRSLVSGLVPESRTPFVPYLEAARTKLEPQQVQQLTSSFGLDHEEDEGQGPKAGTNSRTGNDAQADDDDDRFVLPGTFGKRSAVQPANTHLETARDHLTRRNFAAAVQESLCALQTLQTAGWSIWAKSHSGRHADELISAQVQSADELAKLYGPLVLDERHAQRWVIASHLISLVGQKVTAEQQASLLEVSIDHVSQIVGEGAPAPFAYIGTSPGSNASEALLELLLWTLDHPNWVRRDAAASMLLWLARSDGAWLANLATLAFSMDRRNRADIAAATLDILSRENSARLWHHIESYVDVAQVAEQCRHLSRLVTFTRIAERAGKRGVQSAEAAAKTLLDRFPESSAMPASARDLRRPEYVPSSLQGVWYELSELGLLTDGALQAFASQMADCCSPLGIDMARELEALVAEGGRENADFSNGRWASTVRFALNAALILPMPFSLLKKAEAALRTYNPESLVEPENGNDLLASLVACLENGKERSFVPSDGNLVFLDLQCFIELQGRVAHVELTAHLIPPGQQQGVRPTPPSFKATELPRPGPDEPIAVCGRALPAIAYFGCLSPGIPTPRFLQLVGAQTSNTVRYHWRHGSTVGTLGSSRRHEAALLAIERNSFALPEGWQMQWILRVNGDVRAVLRKF